MTALNLLLRNSNWSAFPSKTLCRSFESRSFSQQQASEQSGSRRCKFLNFLLAISGPMRILGESCGAFEKSK
jgi:hypothetical protein